MNRRKFFKSLAGLVGVAFFGGKLVSEVPPVEDPTKLLLHSGPWKENFVPPTVPYPLSAPPTILVPKHMEETARKMINGQREGMKAEC